MNTQPSPLLFYDTAQAFHRTAALQAAVELDLFTAIGKNRTTAAEVSTRLGTPERSTRILCDFLTVIGFLTKQDGRYALTPDSAMFLDRNSRAFLGNALQFLLSPMMKNAFGGLAEAVRRGTTILDGQGSVSPENPAWVDFARGMASLMILPARMMADVIRIETGGKAKVLDIAAGHGVFGITLAQRYPDVEVTGLDWPGVLEVARENASLAGVASRYHTIAGDAFAVDFGKDYDVILLTNFLHHFDVPTCETLLRKVAASLKPGGCVATIEFVLNDDRVSPRGAANFPLIMLATTPNGDAYSFADLKRMFGNAGFTRNELHDLSPAVQQMVISYK